MLITLSLMLSNLQRTKCLLLSFPLYVLLFVIFIASFVASFVGNRNCLGLYACIAGYTLPIMARSRETGAVWPQADFKRSANPLKNRTVDLDAIARIIHTYSRSKGEFHQSIKKKNVARIYISVR